MINTQIYMYSTDTHIWFLLFVSSLFDFAVRSWKSRRPQNSHPPQAHPRCYRASPNGRQNRRWRKPQGQRYAASHLQPSRCRCCWLPIIYLLCVFGFRGPAAHKEKAAADASEDGRGWFRWKGKRLLFMKRLRMLSSLLAVFLFVSSQKKQDTKAPDKDAILKATASLPTRHTDRTVTQHNIRDVSVQTPRPPCRQPPARRLTLPLFVPVSNRAEENPGFSHRSCSEASGIESRRCGALQESQRWGGRFLSRLYTNVAAGECDFRQKSLF